MGSWHNSDGLYIKYGPDEATAGKGGAYAEGVTGQTVVEVSFNLTSLTTTAAIIDDNVFLPKGWTIMKVEVIATTLATSGGAATLDVGLQRKDRSTDIDDDGLVAALAIGSLNGTGETTVLTQGVTSAGALVGTVTSADYPSYITASYNTAAYTAGVVRVRVFLQRL